MNPHDSNTPANMSLPQPNVAPVSAQSPVNAQQQPLAENTPAPDLSTTPAAPSTEQWVLAAKNIISSTQDDPYAQTELLYELRTQFMQQVHNRSLKQKETDS